MRDVPSQSPQPGANKILNKNGDGQAKLLRRRKLRKLGSREIWVPMQSLTLPCWEDYFLFLDLTGFLDLISGLKSSISTLLQGLERKIFPPFP